MGKRFFLALTFLSFLGMTAFAQKAIKVSGVVTSTEDNQPLPGVSVVVTGTAIGVVTDVDGLYTIDVPADAVSLTFSFIGMQTQELTVIGAKLNVAMSPDANLLDEVIVTAMGFTREKKALGYAIQEVKAGELTKSGSPSVTSALTGKVAGVQVNTFGGTVGASSRISVRGNSSLSADQQPLIVVDGVPITNDTQRTGDDTYNGVDYGSGLNDINPEDIESITVLKGGSAALYGMRAGNGVILVTTKSGKGAAQGISVSYDMNLTLDRVANIPTLQNSYGQGWHASEYYWQKNHPELTYQEFAEKYSNMDGMDESWGPRLDAGLQLVQYDSDGEKAPWVSRPNNIKDFFQTGLTMNHVVSFQDNTEKATTRASISYRDQRGTVPNTDQKRYSAVVNSQMKLNKWVRFDISANFTHTESDNLLAQGYGGGNAINSLVAWSARQMNMKTLRDNWDQKDAAGNFTYYNWIDAYHMNPYFTVNMNTNSYKRNRFYGKGSLIVKATDWLEFEGRAGFDYYDTDTFEKHYVDRSDWTSGGFEQELTRNQALDADIMAKFNKAWDKFSITGVLGANYRDTQYSFNMMGATALVIPGVYTITNADGSVSCSMDHSHIRSNSVYANVSLGWNSMLYLDASARNDWSSTIRQSFFYPSVSLSWLVTETFKGLKKNDVLSLWKLRGGIAQVGSATSAYRNSYYYYPEGNSFNNVPQMYKSYTYPNFNLKPEMVTTWEVGTELGFFNDRLYIDAAYYFKKTQDQILSVTTSNVVGFSSMLVNAGRIDNQGVEVLIRGDIFRNPEGFNWTSTLNFSRDRSEIKELYNDPTTGEALLTTYGIGWTWGIATQARVGEQWGALVGDAYTYVTQDDVDAGTATKDQIGAIKLEKSGTPKKTTSGVMGNVNPKFLMGWNNEFSIKGINFGFLLDLRVGGDIWSQTVSHAYAAGVASITAANGIREREIVLGKDVVFDNERYVVQDASGNWVENNVKTDAQTLFESQGIANRYVFDGSFLKLREAHIGYTLPAKVLRKAGFIKRCDISLIGNNLALLWVHKSNTMRIDPETGGVASNSKGIGFEQASTPFSRSFGLKLGLTF